MTNAQAALMAAASMFNGGAYSNSQVVLDQAEDFRRWLDEADPQPENRAQ